MEDEDVFVSVEHKIFIFGQDQDLIDPNIDLARRWTLAQRDFVLPSFLDVEDHDSFHHIPHDNLVLDCFHALCEGAGDLTVVLY